VANGYFEQQVANIIRRVLREEDATALSTEQVSQLSAQVGSYLFSWIMVIVCLAVIAVVLIAILLRRKRPAAPSEEDMTRQTLLNHLEKEFLQLSQQPSIWLIKRPGFKADHPYPLSVALTPDFTWFASGKPQVVDWSTGEGRVAFTEQGDMINIAVLQDILFWFRRMHRAANSEFIQPEDLAELWPQILPFVTQDRYLFMMEFFGTDSRRGVEEMEAVRQISSNVIRYCQAQKKVVPLDYLKGGLDPLFYEEMPKNMKAGLQAQSSGQSNIQRKEPVLNINPTEQPPADKRDSIRF
jgi:hypothetical protein